MRSTLRLLSSCRMYVLVGMTLIASLTASPATAAEDGLVSKMASQSGQTALPFGTLFHYSLQLNGKEVGTSITALGFPELRDGMYVVTASYEDTLHSMPDLPVGIVFRYESTFTLDDFRTLTYSERVIDGDTMVSELTAHYDWGAMKVNLIIRVHGETLLDELPLTGPIGDSVALMGPLFSWDPAPGEGLTAIGLDTGPILYVAGDVEVVETAAGAFTARRVSYMTRGRPTPSTVWVTVDPPRFTVRISGDLITELVRIEEADQHQLR